MRRGFTLVELLFALLLFQIGLLATAGLVHLAQQRVLRSQLTMRAILEAGLVVDSLEREEERSAGERSYPWGRVLWAPAADEMGGLNVAAFVFRMGDTVAELRALTGGGRGAAAPENPWEPGESGA